MGAGVGLVPPRAPSIPRSLWRFTRPHTITATTASVLTLWLLALVAAPDGAPTTGPLDLVATLAVCLATNVYIVGINQVRDVEIDLVNKPWLPIPAGGLTRRQGLWLSVALGLAALLGAAALSVPLLLTVAAGLLVGSAYSLPPLRLKRFPVAAATSITVVRGPVLTFGVALHFADAWRVSGAVVLLAGVAAAFGLVVAVLKDLPDRRGDTAYGIRTFSNTLDVVVVHRLAMGVLVGTYAAAALLAPLVGGLSWPVLAVGELGCAALAGWDWRRTDPTSPPSAAVGYRWVWRTYYAHHVVVVAAALAALL